MSLVSDDFSFLLNNILFAGAYRREGRNAPPALENFLFFLLTKILKIEKKFFRAKFKQKLVLLPLPLPWTPRYAPGH
jgi:hypothetical protein